MSQKSIPKLKLTISGSIMEHWKAHHSAVKMFRVIGLLHKLKYVYSSLYFTHDLLYNSLILITHCLPAVVNVIEITEKSNQDCTFYIVHYSHRTPF